MMLFSYLLLPVFVAIAGVLAAPGSVRPAGPNLSSRSGTPSESGYNGGYYYSFSTAGTSNVVYTNGAGGTYSVQWNGNGDFIAGKGWSTGSAQSITYAATFNPTGDCFFGVIGWFTNPLIEYYIIDDWSGYNPGTGGTVRGTLTSDGGQYTVYESTRVNAPSIQGTSTFNVYYSVRQAKRTSGTITTANHFAAWRRLGMPTGTFNEQFLAVECWTGSGGITVTVS